MGNPRTTVNKPQTDMINHGNGVLTTGRNRALKPEKASERTPEKERNENGLENGLQIREAGRKWAKLQKQTQGFFMEVVLRTLILSLMLLANSKMVRAASITWTNTAGGDWNNALNWNPNLVPGSGDSASIPSGALNVIIDSTNATGSLTLGNGSTLTIATNGVLDIEAPFTIEGEVTNAGTVNWQAGTIEVLGPAGGYTGEIWNQAGALWDIQCDAPLQGGFGGETFHNAGVVQKDTTTGTTSFNVFLNNAGTIHANTGTISFNQGSDLGGIFHAENGAAIYFAGGAYTISSAPINFQGPGIVELTGGNVTLDGLVGTLNLNGSSLVGQNTISGTGTLNLTGGTLGNGSSLTITTNGVLDIEAPFTIEGEVTNAGTVNWQAGTIEVLGPAGGYTGEIWNQAGALWDIQCDAPLQGGFGGETFHNAGVVQKDTTTGTTSFNIYLANSGSLNAESGTIALNENYTETSLAKQMISIGGTEPNTSYGQIQFASPHFAGSFNITLLNGFRPNPGDSFSLLSYPSLTGDFNSMNGLDLGNGLKLVPHFSNTSLSLTAAAYSENSRPALSIYPTPSDELVSWPLNFTGWQLLTSTNLSTAAWTGIAVPGTNNNIVLPRNGVKGFYRLKSN